MEPAAEKRKSAVRRKGYAAHFTDAGRCTLNFAARRDVPNVDAAVDGHIFARPIGLPVTGPGDHILSVWSAGERIDGGAVGGRWVVLLSAGRVQEVQDSVVADDNGVVV